MDSLVITGMSWVDDEPHLRVRQPPDASSVLVPAVGFAMNYQVGPESTRHCVGHKPFRDKAKPWHDCNRSPLHDGVKCDRCAAADATFASQLHHAHHKARGELDSAILGHLDQANELYLAAFRDGSIKVGTSTAPRLKTRLAEQGAWKARIVATAADGFAVRSIEDKVTTELGLPQSVSARRKVDGLAQPVPDSRLDKELDIWLGRVHELIESTGDDRLTDLSIIWESTQQQSPVWDRVHHYPLKVTRGAHDVEIAAMSGRIAALHRPRTGDMFVADVRPLFGIELSLGDHEPDELAVQDSLF